MLIFHWPDLSYRAMLAAGELVVSVRKKKRLWLLMNDPVHMANAATINVISKTLIYST